MFPASVSLASRRASLLMRAGVLVLLLLFLLPSAVSARDGEPSFLIVVHPKIEQKVLERSFVQDAFLKKQTRWPNGNTIQPVDLDTRSSVRDRFSHAVLKRSVAAVRSYWQQQIFSGRGVPPPQVKSDEAAVRFVASHAGGIGYVSSNADLKGVRVVALKD